MILPSPIHPWPSDALLAQAPGLISAHGNWLKPPLPRLGLALGLLLLGWLVASLIALAVRKLVERAQVDQHLTQWIQGPSPEFSGAVAQGLSRLIYWILLLLILVACLDTLQLGEIADPLRHLLSPVLAYLPRVGGAMVLLSLGWLSATGVRSRLLHSLNHAPLAKTWLTSAAIVPSSQAEGFKAAIANLAFWLIWLLLVPLILGVLGLSGLLRPVESLLSSLFQALPRILTAVAVLGVGWLLARILRGGVTNLLVAIGADQMGGKLGLLPWAGEELLPSRLGGNLAYLLVLLPTLITALEELDLEALAQPAIRMLERTLMTIPQVLMAGLVVWAAYWLGRWLGLLVTEVLRGLGFDQLPEALGVPYGSWGAPLRVVRHIDGDGLPQPSVERLGPTPAEVAGVLVVVGVVLVGLATAADILKLPGLTAMVSSLLQLAGRLLSGVVVFGAGLYLANWAARWVGAIAPAPCLAQIVRASLVVTSAAMALQQLGVAPSFVNLAFGLLLGRVVLALAIAFGLGGREVAAEQLRHWLTPWRQR